MDRRNHTPRFELQEASDTELTPPCPTFERTNPFDDLTPSNMPVSPTFKMPTEPEKFEPNLLGMRRKNIQGGMSLVGYAQERDGGSITVSRKSLERSISFDQPFSIPLPAYSYHSPF